MLVADSIKGSLRALSRRERLILALIAFARSATNLLDLAGIALVGVLGAIAIDPTFPIPFIGSLDFLGHREKILVLAFVSLTLFLGKNLTGIFLSRKTLFFLARLEHRLADRVAHGLFHRDLKEFAAYSRGEVQWAVIHSTHVSVTQILSTLVAIASETFLMIGIFIVFFAVDWRAGATVALYSCALVYLFHLTNRAQIVRAGRGLADGHMATTKELTGLVDTYREVSVSQKTGFFLERLSRAHLGLAESHAANAHLATIPRLIMEMGLLFGGFLFVLVIFLTQDGLDALPIFGIFAVGSLRLMGALLPVQRGFLTLIGLGPQAKLAQDLLEDISSAEMHRKTETLSDSLVEVPGHPKGPIGVQVRDVVFEYDSRSDEEPALAGLSLTIPPGSFAAVVGPSGAGKSTLADIILGLQKPDSGEVRYQQNGSEPGRMDPSAVLSYVPQKPGFAPGSILENIALGFEQSVVDRDRVWEVLSLVGLAGFVEGLPRGLHTNLGKNVDGLSGGQAQRLGLARALYPRPQLLLLDEPTSALDAETELLVSSGLEALKGIATVVVIAHRISTIKEADIVFLLEAGKLSASGKFGEVRDSQPLFRKYVDLMSFQGSSPA